MANGMDAKDGKKYKEIKMSDDDLYPLVRDDIDAAERYFDANIKPQIITRYQVLHSNKDYYREKFATLSQSSDFSTSDVKDAVEWIMPSIVEIIFGAEKIIGISGRTPDDNPESAEKLMFFQMKKQNKGYKIITQYVRDMLEAGLGVLKTTWRREEETQEQEVTIPEAQFIQIPEEMIKPKSVKDNGDGTYSCKIVQTVVTKNQPDIENLMPGRWIFLPDKDENGASVFEAEKGYFLYSDLMKWERDGLIKNVKDVAPKMDYSDSDRTLDDIAEAVLNYTGERLEKQSEDTNQESQQSASQPAREKILVYKCYGKYDINDDSILEDCCVWVAGDTIIRKEVYEYSKPPFIDGYAFDRSYGRWKEAVADLLQDTQDLKTAVTRQIIINTALNNQRVVAMDEKQSQAIEDQAMGRSIVRLKLDGNKSVKDLMDYFPDHKLSSETFPFLEMIQGWSEQKTGVTRYNQGLDADSLNKTATGISKIMAASQQRLRMIARNIAESGLVPLFEFLLELNQKNVDQEMVVRLTGEYLTIKPDDINGKYDVEIKSNIGLQDSAMMVQQLMLLFTQIIPPLMQMGIATPVGVYETAKQIIQQMGFNNPSEIIGADENQIQGMMQQQNVMQQLPQLLGGLMKQAGTTPEQAGAVVQGLMAAMQPPQKEGQPA